MVRCRACCALWCGGVWVSSPPRPSSSLLGSLDVTSGEDRSMRYRRHTDAEPISPTHPVSSTHALAAPHAAATIRSDSPTRPDTHIHIHSPRDVAIETHTTSRRTERATRTGVGSSVSERLRYRSPAKMKGRGGYDRMSEDAEDGVELHDVHDRRQPR